MDLDPSPSQGAIRVWSDASGHIIASPSLGLFVPSSGQNNPLVASLAFPRSFFKSCDEKGHKAYCKTTTLESLAYLAVLCTDPLRFVAQEVVFHIDNFAAVIALKRGRARRDPWASTLIRAARVVASDLGCSIFAVWERRRSSRNSEIADDLTHNLVRNLSDHELRSYIRMNALQFPKPILEWMACPGPDAALGKKCIGWMHQQFPQLPLLKSV